MRVMQQPAFILHRHHYGESSLLLEIFTPDFGRLGVIAKGARRTASEYRAILNPFQPLSVSWSGKGELVTLTRAEVESQAYALVGNILFCGFYINELVLRLLHRHDPHESLFTVYKTALGNLQEQASCEAVLRIFEKRLLGELGYGLVLDYEIERRAPILPDAAYLYILNRGPVALKDADAQGIKIRGASLLALANETLIEAAVLHETKILLRAVLAEHMGGKPLKTRQLFRNLKRAPATVNHGPD